MNVWVYFEQKKEKWKLIKFRFYIPVRTKYVISEMLFPAKFLASTEKTKIKNQTKLECGPMPNVMVALPNIDGALCSIPQSLADAHY